MRSFLPIAWRHCSRIDIYAWSDDGTWGLERGMISDTSYHSFSNVGCIEANILIDEDGNAQLADFGSTILSEDPEVLEDSGTLRWMSPELLDPQGFGAENYLPTKESDCYALGMVILEVLTGGFPFQDLNNLAVMRKVIDGEHPSRPNGPEAVWFTDDLWAMLEKCWSNKPKHRPTIEGVLECLEQGLTTWKPLSLSADSDSQVDSDDDSVSTMSHNSCVFSHLVFDFGSPEQRSSLLMKPFYEMATNLQLYRNVVRMRTRKLTDVHTLCEIRAACMF